jgi:hypothetical protein
LSVSPNLEIDNAKVLRTGLNSLFRLYFLYFLTYQAAIWVRDCNTFVIGCIDADPELSKAVKNMDVKSNASMLTVLNSNLLRSLLCILAYSLLDILLYSLSDPFQALFPNIERFILSRSIFEAKAAASILSNNFFLCSLSLSFLFSTNIHVLRARLRSQPSSSVLVPHA